MSPNFLPDEFVFVLHHPFQKLKVGDVVVVNHYQYGDIIKRVSAIGQTGLSLAGDSPKDSVSSQQMGLVTRKQVLGKVALHVPKKTSKS